MPAPDTLVSGVRHLPPATTAVFDANGLQAPRPYWTSPLLEAPSTTVSWGDACEIVRTGLRQAVEKRLASDVPVGVLLSGGLDSAAVVAVLASLGVRLRTFTAGMPDEPTYDEREAAASLARHFGTEHTELEIRVDAAGIIDKSSGTSINRWLTRRASRRFSSPKKHVRAVTVVLTGDGGDEMFGGYDRFRGLLLSQHAPAAAQKPLSWMSRAVPRRDTYGALRGRLDRFAGALSSAPADRYASWVTLFDDSALRSVLREAPQGDELSSFHGAWTEAAGQPLLHQALHANLRTYLHDDLLVKTDRMTMAHGLEARSPFLDVPLMEAVAALPPHMKATARESKRVLRRAIGNMVPADVLKRPKHGFGVPVGAWFRGELREPFTDLVLSGDARIATVVDPDAVGAMYRDHSARRADHGQRLWALLALESWLRGRERGLGTDAPRRTWTGR